MAIIIDQTPSSNLILDSKNKKYQARQSNWKDEEKGIDDDNSAAS
jgi:hypothetical protein